MFTNTVTLLEMKSLGECRHIQRRGLSTYPFRLRDLAFLLQGAHACVKQREGQGHHLFISSYHLIFHIMFGVKNANPQTCDLTCSSKNRFSDLQVFSNYLPDLPIKYQSECVNTS